MLLGIKTDNPVAEFVLFDAKGELLGQRQWEADRSLARYLLQEIEHFLTTHGIGFQQLTGLFVFEGPGSFTGLRIGVTVMNTLAYTLEIPIVSTRGDQWQEDAVKRLKSGEKDAIVLPVYGADARITQPKK